MTSTAPHPHPRVLEPVARRLLGVAIAVALAGVAIWLTASSFDQVQQSFGLLLLIMVAPSALLAAWLAQVGRPWVLPFIIGCFGTAVAGAAASALAALLTRHRG